MNIAVIGLGLIGGSVAKSLKGFMNCKIIGCDKDNNIINDALSDEVISEGYTDGGEFLKNCDFIILCLYPSANIEFIKENAQYLKSGAIITDVSGVKEFIISKITALLPENVEFVGGHPMAGKELGGYANSCNDLFKNASFLITPSEKNKPETVDFIEKFAKYIGCARIVRTTPKEHDAVIAYTSQLMHVVAIALCQSPILEKSALFSAGSLRDCTRVALINEKMWSELFLENKNELSQRIEEMIDNLKEIKDTLDSDDRTGLEEIMKVSKERKLKWLSEKYK